MRKLLKIGIIKICVGILLIAIIVNIGIAIRLNKNSSTSYSSNITINQIREVAKLSTIEYLVESHVVIDDKGKVVFSITLPGTEKTYIAVAQGQVVAGIDLEKLNSFVLKDGKAEIQLPKAEILYKTIDPSTKWEKEMSGIFVHITPEEITKAEEKAQSDMVKRAIQENILVKADSSAKK